MIDHSVPREIGEVRRAAVALGTLAEVVAVGKAHILITPILRAFVTEFIFEPWDHPDLRTEMYRLLTQWILQPHDGVLEIDVSTVQKEHDHPLPSGCAREGLAESWSDECAKILIAHDRCGCGGDFFIGIACTQAFAGEPLVSYETAERALPLVGPPNLSTLLDAYEWEIDYDVQKTEVTFERAKKNCFAIGAVAVNKPKKGSHYKVHFDGARTWPLDSNLRRVPVRFLSQLIEITGYPLPVIRHALITGSLPRRRTRLWRHLA